MASRAGRTALILSAGSVLILASTCSSVSRTSVTRTKVQPLTLAKPTTVAAAAAACANEAFPTTGTIHYVCDCGAGADSNCVVGSDSAAGTSPSAPWRTYSKGVNAISSMAAGDTVAFCKGGSFAVTASIFTASSELPGRESLLDS